MKYKKGFIDLIALGLISAIVLAVSVFSYVKVRQEQPKQITQSFGAFNPTGGQTYRLQSSISSTQNTITLSSFKEPVSNIKYTMSYLNSSIEYATIDPNNTSSKEFVSFTGITQNSDNTATLTGVTRGLAFSYPYTASTTLAQPHSGQSIFILSNPPQLTNQYANKSNDEAVTGLWNFNSYLPTTSILATTSNQFVNKAYADALAIAGAPNSSESAKGIIQLATQVQMASSTNLGSTGASLVLQSQYATSSPYKAGLWVPITQNDGTLNPNFISTTSPYNWSNATSTFNATTTFNAGVYIATSSPVVIGGVNIGTSTYFGKAVTIGGTASTTSNTNLIVNGLATTTNLVVSNGCTGCTGVTLVSGAMGNFNGGTPSTKTTSLSCTGNLKASGGGVSGSAALPGSWVYESYPSSATAWTISENANNNGFTGSAGTIYVICVNP